MGDLACPLHTKDSACTAAAALGHVQRGDIPACLLEPQAAVGQPCLTALCRAEDTGHRRTMLEGGALKGPASIRLCPRCQWLERDEGCRQPAQKDESSSAS